MKVNKNKRKSKRERKKKEERRKRKRNKKAKLLYLEFLKKTKKYFLRLLIKLAERNSIIQGKILEGSTIYTDGWKAYNGLILNGYITIIKYFTVRMKTYKS